MAATPFPLPRDDRETDVLEGDGATVTFGPFDFKIFDVEDVEILKRVEGLGFFEPVEDVTVAKTTADPFSFFTVTFAIAPADGAAFVARGARTAERQLAVTKGGSISGGELEKELSKQAVALSELRRDVNRAPTTNPGEPRMHVAPIGEGHFWKADAGGNMVDGGSAADILEAQGHAASAAEDADRAEAALESFLGLLPAQYAADRTALAAVNTALYDVAYLKETGRAGMFRRVLTVAYSSWISADTRQGVLVLSTHDASYSWLRIGIVNLDIRWFGAVGDGAVAIDDTTNIFTPTGTGAVTGTDNLAAIRAAVIMNNLMTFPVYVPVGSFRCAVPNASQTTIVPVGAKFHIYGEAGQSWLIIDDDYTYNAIGQTGNTFFGSAQLYDAATYDQGLNQYFIMRNLGLRGTWWRDVEKGAKTWTSANNYRVHAIGPTNTQHVLIQNVLARDIIGFFSRARSCQKIEYIHCDTRRVTGDGLRAEDCSHVLWDGNFILHNGDDAMTNPDIDDKPNNLGPRRQVAIMVNNRVLCSEAPLILGPAHVIMQNNSLFLTYGSGLAVAALTVEANDRGEGGFRSILIGGNIIENHMRAHNNADPPDNAWLNIAAVPVDSYAMTITGAVDAASPLGGGSATPVAQMPWSNAAYKWGAMHVQDQVGTDAAPDDTPGFRASGLVVTPNIIRRTLPPAAAYSDWGYGKRFTRYGFDDPAVTDTEFALHGIRFNGMFDDADIQVGHISGFVNGSGIRLAGTTNDMAYRGFRIRGGTIKNVRDGISADAGSTKHQDITVECVEIDVDPYRLSAARGADNRWASVLATDPCAIQFTHLRGVTLINNTFKNCANMWALEGGVGSGSETPSFNTLRGNIGVVDFTNSAGTSTTHADNRGIGRIVPCSEGITYEVRDLSPASGTFGQKREGMRLAGGAQPSTGYYVKGHVHRNLDGTTSNRLLTGTAHVVTTDWATNP